MADQPIILLAEDLEDDIILIQRAFTKANVSYPLVVVRTGDEAISYLAGEGPFSERQRHPLPILFLLDLKLPLKDGFEILRWRQTRPELKDLPIIVLTLSNRIRDVNEAYTLGAYSFLIKTIDFQDTAAFARSLSDYLSTSNKNAEPNAPPAAWPAKENLAPETGIAAYPEPPPTAPQNEACHSDAGARELAATRAALVK